MSLVRENVFSAVLDDIVAVVRAVARVGGCHGDAERAVCSWRLGQTQMTQALFLTFPQVKASSGKVQRPRWNNIKPYTRKAFQSLLKGLGAFDIPESREKRSFDSSSYLQSKLLKELGKNSQFC